MPTSVYLILAIAVIVALVVVFVVSFLLYIKQPAPKGCENLEPAEGICSACTKSGCDFYAQYHSHDDAGPKGGQ